MPRSFQGRLALFFSVLLIGIQALTLAAVYGVVRANAIAQMDGQLAYDQQVFQRLMMARGERLASETRILAADFGFRSAVGAGDPETVRSALDNLTRRIHGQRGIYIGLDGRVVADTAGTSGAAFAFPDALVEAENQGWAVTLGFLDGGFGEWAVVPVQAPITLGWVAIGLDVDQGYLDSYRSVSPPGLHITLLEPAAPHAWILASSLAPRLRAELALALPLAPAMVGGEGWVMDVEDTSFLTRVHALPMADAGRTVWAVVQIDLEGALRPYTMLWRIVLGLSVAGLVAALVGGYLLAGWIARPLRDLARATEDMIGGRFAAPLPVERGDELGRLAETFNRAGRMALEMDELRRQDRARRELVANVSHDLRSPLTALRGYLETMSLRADSLPPEERQRFLAVAVRQSEQLGRLAQALFELARLECDEGCVQSVAFPVGELAWDVAQKYALVAQQRGVHLEITDAADWPWVWADPGLLERVLDNLIDNALRHTPAGGTVRMTGQSVAGRWEMAVMDTGIGIAADDLARLFDWDSPLGRRAGRQSGGGLGLILVGRIVRLHGGTLRAESTLGQGTVLRFDLPLAKDHGDLKSP